MSTTLTFVCPAGLKADPGRYAALHGRQSRIRFTQEPAISGHSSQD
ncbi:hypothetical protein FB597_1032 [Herbaspirillum sp. SJZ099]|nr:hypothetical protein FB597_1032 [Herbaspirillum sp. SJZ099]